MIECRRESRRREGMEKRNKHKLKRAEVEDKLYGKELGRVNGVIASEVKRRREEMGITRNELRARTGATLAVVYGIEEGNVELTIKHLVIVASGLGCSVSDLVRE